MHDTPQTKPAATILPAAPSVNESRDLHDRFMLLANEQIERAGPRPRLLRALYDYKQKDHPEGWETENPEQGPVSLLKAAPYGVWMLSGGVNEKFRKRFQIVAAQAGHALGCPKDADPVEFWLHCLSLDLRENYIDEFFAEPSDDEGGVIEHLCEASATFCSRLEKKVRETLAPPAEQHRESMATPSDEKKPIKELTVREQKIWEVIKLRTVGRLYCRELDNAHIKPRRTGSWKDCPGTYLGAYDGRGHWRQRIQDEKSKIRRKAEQLAKHSQASKNSPREKPA